MDFFWHSYCCSLYNDISFVRFNVAAFRWLHTVILIYIQGCIKYNRHFCLNVFICNNRQIKGTYFFYVISSFRNSFSPTDLHLFHCFPSSIIVLPELLSLIPRDERHMAKVRNVQRAFKWCSVHFFQFCTCDSCSIGPHVVMDKNDFSYWLQRPDLQVSS